MRAARWFVAYLATLGAPIMACGGDAPEGPAPPAPSLLDHDGDGHVPPTRSGDGPKPPAPASPELADVDPATLGHPEVVLVLMEGKDGWTWFCTGALVSKSVVVTAAHCLQPELFRSWEVVAPTLRARPRVRGEPRMYDEDWNQAGRPDLGIVRLESPIELPQYGSLVDVTARVEAGERLMTATVVRTVEEPEAPFKKTADLEVFSTAKIGYTHGYGVPLYSRGGDSGAGMFLVENGRMTHEIIAVEREPDPKRKMDHLTRVDRPFIDWVARNGT
jgi:hypothetical protein